MKHIFRTLLGLVLVVFVLAGCSSLAGPEIPEDNIKSVEVEFVWGNYSDQSKAYSYAPMYLLSLDSEKLTYGFTGDDFDSYCELYSSFKNPENPEFKEFYDSVLKETFSTEEYKEGTIIDLEQWTTKAIRLDNKGYDSGWRDFLYFSFEDKRPTKADIENIPDEIIVGTENLKVYVFFISEKS